jgi:hypothetical protein
MFAISSNTPPRGSSLADAFEPMTGPLRGDIERDRHAAIACGALAARASLRDGSAVDNRFLMGIKDTCGCPAVG